MKYDFEKGLADSKKMDASKALNLIVLGQSGAGKSFLAGTLGVKTLYLYMSGESHGSSSAKASSDADLIDSYCVDMHNGVKLSPDDTLTQLTDILKNVELIRNAGYKLIVVDSAGELETTIRGSAEWDRRTRNDKDKHDPFRENDATYDMLRKVTEPFKALQRDLDVHTMITCILDVRSVGEMGEILESSPRIRGAKIAENLCQQMDDVIAIGRMHKDGVTKHKIQLGCNMSKVSKEVSGAVKFTNYSPRVKGVPTDKLPPFMDADLKELHALKIKGKDND